MDSSLNPTITPTADDGPAPACEFAFGERVRIGPLIRVGPSKRGIRQLFPIEGGTIGGAIKGEVLPGGADWQLVRNDGVIELDARYTIRTEDDVTIHVRNRGLVHGDDGKPYLRTSADFEAPADGPYAWLNRAVFVGDAVLRDAGTVDIRFFKVV